MGKQPEDGGPDRLDDVISEIVRQLPIRDLYEDAIREPGKELGGAVGDIVKAVRLALAPIQFLAALQDRYVRFLDQSVRKVPEDRRIPPAPQILGPVLEGIRYEPEDTSIDRMFSELLARAMDKERVEEAHPAYPFIVRQLSPDEAVVLSLLRDRIYEYQYTSTLGPQRGRFHRREVELDEFPSGKLTFPDNLSFYMDHLNHLDLAGLFEYKNQEPLHESEDKNIQTGTKVFCQYRLTRFGERFVRACIAGDN